MNKEKEIIAKYSAEFKELNINSIVKNPWNPNIQSDIVFNSVKKSIEKHGLLQFPVVRRYVGQYQIIDGEHKWRACKELGYQTIKALVLGTDENEVTDDDAMTLTELLNTRGMDDPIKQAQLIREIQKQNPNQLPLLPYTDKELKNKIDLIEFDFSKYDKEEKVEIKRNRTMIFALSEEEYEIMKHSLSLVGKAQTESIMTIIRDYLEVREDISKWKDKKEEIPA
jgi:ParB family chromosome partitioning protein